MNAITKPVSEGVNMSLQPDCYLSEGIPMSEEEYLATEPYSEVRREYIDGYAYAMSGASSNHNLLAGNLFGHFWTHLRGKPCSVFMSDMKVPFKLIVGNNYVYPDLVVDCDKTGENRYSVGNPILIVEVLSGSTRKLDQTTKLLRYINLPSLQEYIMVEQDIVLITVLRKSNHWKPENYYFGDPVTFESIGLTLSVEAIYERVDNHEMAGHLKQKQMSKDIVTVDTVIEPLSSDDFLDGIIKG